MADLQLPNTVEEEEQRTVESASLRTDVARVAAALSHSQGKGKDCIVKINDSSEESKKM